MPTKTITESINRICHRLDYDCFLIDSERDKLFKELESLIEKRKLIEDAYEELDKRREGL